MLFTHTYTNTKTPTQLSIHFKTGTCTYVRLDAMHKITYNYTYQSKQVQQKLTISSDDVEGSAAEIHKSLEFVWGLLSSIYNICHVRCQHKSCAISFKAAKLLCIPKEFAKINMKEVTWSLQHNVVIVAITDSKYVSSNTICSTWSCRKKLVLKITVKTRWYSWIWN